MHASFTPTKSFMDVLQEQIEGQQSKLLDQQAVPVPPTRAVVSPIVPEKEGLRSAEKALQYSAGRESYGVMGDRIERDESPEVYLSDPFSSGYDVLSNDAAKNESLIAANSVTSLYMAAHQSAFRVII